MAFTSNGLLELPVPDNVQESSLLEDAFAPNGLLGLESSRTWLGRSRSEDLSSDGSTFGDDFEANGLLGGTSSITRRSTPFDNGSQPFTSNGLLADSQEESLPDVSEIVGPIDLSKHNRTSERTSEIQRIPLRARTFEGKGVYLRRKLRTRISHQANVDAKKNIGNLLDTPIHRMMEELSLETAHKLNLQVPRPSKKKSDIGDTLWVDRYRPKRFTELMGNERVGRETMAWVKHWDWCVFGKATGKRKPREGDGNFSNDEYHRPQERILLISGPPGLGKTTLAYVVARQAGYEVMEINASDARSASIVDERIRPTLETGSAIGSTKPVLLIIDEIDGATGDSSGGGFIHKLIQLVQEKPARKGKRDSKSKRPILRPIICICNNLYASSLNSLRPLAYQIRFMRPADVHTVRRLREICASEGLKADTRALTALVGVAQGDLRSCLNTLQFIKSRNEEVTEGVIRKATAGMKEAETSVSSVLNSIFAPLPKKRVMDLGLTEAEEARYVSRLSREVEGSGRESYVADGCFAHYASLRQHDANFTRHEKASEWLVTFDTMSSAMYNEGDFALNQYLPFLLVPFYPLFQERGGGRFERSQMHWEHLKTLQTNEEIYKCLVRSQTSNKIGGGDYRHLMGTPVLQLEFVPFINRIISPPIRPVNRQVVRPEERAVLTRLVHIMASLELRFVQEKSENNQLTYRLDPPIDVFVTYDGKRASDISVSRYAVRHLVAGEVEAELSARQFDAVERQKKPKGGQFDKLTAKRQAEDDPDNEVSSKRARKDKVDIADKPPTDFFGRPIVHSKTKNVKSLAREYPEKKFNVTYRFAEGSSAAVRKPVKVHSFM